MFPTQLECQSATEVSEVFSAHSGCYTHKNFHYERLRGLCEVCGMITHDSGRCLIQNGGPEDSQDDGDDDQMAKGEHPGNPGNPGVHIEVIIEEEATENANEDAHENQAQHPLENQVNSDA